ncbi:hypothetical protein [Steroidobacter sp.]|uniref:hypothetical protein n=1 Tax=Steroidobacter sp. TaxID=1978227 RepID=UPI0025E12A14|nr:hypothetical protein [Steroidobacter sp.]
MATALALPLALTACSKRSDETTVKAETAAPSGSAPGQHLILSVSEGLQAPKELLGTLLVQQGAGTSVELPWVQSVKREAPSGFEHLAVLAFADGASLEAWRSVHATQLVAPLSLKQAQVLTKSAANASGSASAMFKISYYSLVAPVPKFQEWVDGYLTKYLEAQRSKGILTSYVMYLEDRGRALLVLEYPDAATEQSAEPIKEKLSEELAASDPVYAQLMPLKEELRTTQSWTLAVPVTQTGS